jgi:hypothetical protein
MGRGPLGGPQLDVKGPPVGRQRAPSWASKGPQLGVRGGALFDSAVARSSCCVVVLLHEQRKGGQAERIFGHAY